MKNFNTENQWTRYPLGTIKRSKKNLVKYYSTKLTVCCRRERLVCGSRHLLTRVVINMADSTFLFCWGNRRHGGSSLWLQVLDSALYLQIDG